MSLEKYKRKRKFNKTPEPKGGLKSSVISRKLKFVIHDHRAIKARHHHDFRLEMNSVLKSWAVPKLTPTEPGTKRLAVQVEDHPIGYVDFSGIIPQGQYGAGEVKIFDKGTYRMIEKGEGRWKFELFGKKLKGIYHLIRLTGNPKNWLLFKK